MNRNDAKEILIKHVTQVDDSPYLKTIETILTELGFSKGTVKLEFRGPGIMVAVIAVIMAFGGLIALALVHKFPGLFR
jgi:hypothetical protein